MPRASAKPLTAERRLRDAVIATARDMSRRGLSPGRSGNVSCRHIDGMLVTPSGIAYETLERDAIVRMSLDGATAPGALKPSSEWQMHAAIYRARPDAMAIVHTHSMHATVLACAGHAIPAFHYMVAAAGGSDIPLVPYATFGTAVLAEAVAMGLAHRNACLMAHHGQVAIGPTLAAALELAADVEVLAEQYWKVLALGPPKLLSPDEMARVLARFTRYGQNAQA